LAAIAKQTIGKYSLDSSRKYPQGVEVEDGNFRVTLVSRAPKVVLVIGGYGQSKKVKSAEVASVVCCNRNNIGCKRPLCYRLKSQMIKKINVSTTTIIVNLYVKKNPVLHLVCVDKT